jgi:hypothetical protein
MIQSGKDCQYSNQLSALFEIPLLSETTFIIFIKKAVSAIANTAL